MRPSFFIKGRRKKPLPTGACSGLAGGWFCIKEVFLMLRSIKTFFEKKIRPAEAVTSRRATDEALRLATAALLIEAVKADANISDEELDAVRAGLERKFGLSGEDMDRLMDLAQRELDDAPSLYGFTRLVDKGFGYDDKKEIIELLWEVVYADGVLDKHEEHLVRRVADLVQVSHKDFIDAKLRVKGRLKQA
jgi:uncharacterized tellurite resistance protein B-like protein